VKSNRLITAVLLCITVTTGWVVSRQITLSAAEDKERSYREAYAGDAPVATAESQGVRLNFFDATWKSVLEHVASEYDLTLIMDTVPPGRFARRDRTYYQFDEAIRILNAELQSQGFRLLRQKRYLIVLNLDKARTEYARPRVDTSSSAVAQQQARAEALRNNIAQRTYYNSGSQSAGSQMESVPVRPLFNAGDRGFQQVGRSENPVSTVSSTSMASPRQVQPEPPGEMVMKSVACQNTKAADTARSIYLVFQKRAELEQNGLKGLPTFTVFDQEEVAVRQPVFRVGIDQYNNELILEAPAARLPHLQRLIGELDKPMTFGQDTVKLLPNNGLTAETADELNEQIQKLLALQQREARLTGAAGNFAAADEPQQMAPPAGQAAAPEQDGTLNLRGDVNLQALQDLGILILQGNQADVDKVAEIIARLETMSVGTVPSIEILSLSSVNSEALAELLTSVYEELTDLRSRIGQEDRKAAAFVPVVQPNAVLVIASPLEMDAIRKLADELDVPLDPEFEFRVYPLKNAIASQVVSNLETFYEDRGGLGVRVRVVADVRTNSLVIQGRPTELAEVGQLIEKIDRDDSGAVHRVQIFELKNAIAEELATTINTAIQSVVNPPQQTQGGQFGGAGGFGANAQGAQELRDSKSVALEFLTTDGNARELIRSGIMVDVRVNADIRTNTLIVSAPEASMTLMSALIETLDRAPTAVADVKIFTLQNADAEQSVVLLESLFENQNQEDELGIQIAGSEGAPSSLIPLQFSADIRTNSVLAVGGAESLSVVEAILLRLDTDDTRQRETTVIPLNNAPAEVVADALTRFLEQQAALQDSTEDLISNIERLRQEVLIAEDINSNSLIVSASPTYFSQITEIIATLDATPPEVVIQALLVEVALDSTDEFGIELGFQDPLLYSRSLLNIVEGAPTPGLNFNNTTIGLANPSTATATSNIVGTQGLSNFSLGRQNTDLGFGGFVFSAQSDAVSVLLRALAARRTVHILSRPQIRTTNNNLALVRVGQLVPVVNGVNITNLGVANPLIEQQAVGLILQVTPRIRDDGVIAMEVYAEKSALSDQGVPVFVQTDGSTIESPIIDQAIADTTVNVPNGQTIVIGGLITKNDSSLERKVPWLGDLPIVGQAFRFDSNRIRRTELLIFLTPRIILGDVDSELIKQVEAERMHFIESEAEEIHGPLYSVPPGGSQFGNGQFGDGVYCPPGEAGSLPRGADYMSDDLRLEPTIEPSPTPAPVEPQLNRANPSRETGGDWEIEPVSGEAEKDGQKAKRASWWRR
jgi:general secretion pathway protein D